MLWHTLISTLVLMSFSVVALAQTPPAKPKTAPKKRPAASKPAPAPVAPVAAPAPPPPPATDVLIRTRYTTGAQVSENTTYIKGSRQRFEFPGITMIAQCDMKRSLQLHDGTKHYMVVSTDTPAPAAARPSESPADGNTAAQFAAMSMGAGGAASPKPKGGVISETITVTDTGEREQMFGLEARHIRTSVVRQPGEGACETSATTVETDGWYAELPEQVSCPVSAPQVPATPPADQQVCVDRVVTTNSSQTALGFALRTVMTTTVVDTKDKDKTQDVTTMSMEVMDLKVTSLDNALFELPPGYTEVKDYSALLPSLASGGSLADAVFGSLTEGTSEVAPKKAGVIRVGIVTPTNKSGKDLPDMRLVGSLLSGFTKAPFEALPVSGETAGALDSDAAAKACDYILVSDIAAIKTSKPNKVGGFLKKVSGDVSAPTEIHEVRVDYKLYAVGDQAAPKITSSVKASSGGGFGVRSALRVAAFAGQTYLTMGMGSGMMGMMGPGAAFGGMGGLSGGLLSGRMNPGMGAAMSIMSASGSMGLPGGMGGIPGMSDPAEGRVMETVQDGLSKAVKQVTDELKKDKTAKK